MPQRPSTYDDQFGSPFLTEQVRVPVDSRRGKGPYAPQQIQGVEYQTLYTSSPPTVLPVSLTPNVGSVISTWIPKVTVKLLSVIMSGSTANISGNTGPIIWWVVKLPMALSAVGTNLEYTGGFEIYGAISTVPGLAFGGGSGSAWDYNDPETPTLGSTECIALVLYQNANNNVHSISVNISYKRL